MSDKTEVKLMLEPEVAELLDQDGIDADLIVNGLLELKRAEEQLEGNND